MREIQTELGAETGHLIPRAQNMILGSKKPMFIGVCGSQISGSGMVRSPRRQRNNHWMGGESREHDMEVAQSEQDEVGILVSPWLTVREAAARARCGAKLIYREVRAGRLRAARVGGRRELRFLVAWVDEWLLSHCTIQESS